jgi:transposase
MGRGKQVTPRKRAVISQYIRDGLSVSEISTRLKIPRTTVFYIAKRYKTSGAAEAANRTGRPRITSKRDDNVIRRSAVKIPGISSLEILHQTGIKASTRTIRRRLFQQFRLAARRPARKPLLHEVQRRKRIAFCRKYRHWKAEDWSKVLFSDESTFCQFGSSTNFVRRP